MPRIDEKLLANKPEQIYQQEDFRTIPILAGSTLKDPSFLIKSTQKTVQDFSSLGEKHTYLYRFDYDDHFLGWLIGGVHGFELPLVFDTAEFASLGDGALYAYQDLSLKRAENLSHKVQAYWGNFMRTGNPNGVDHEGKALANWPVYSENKPDLLVLDRPFKIERMK